MELYRVAVSKRAENDLLEIVETSRYAYEETQDYIKNIRDFCSSLKEKPYRLKKDPVANFELHSYTYKAHKIYYHISEKTKTVSIVAVLAGRKEQENHF